MIASLLHPRSSSAHPLRGTSPPPPVWLAVLLLGLGLGILWYVRRCLMRGRVGMRVGFFANHYYERTTSPLAFWATIGLHGLTGTLVTVGSALMIARLVGLSLERIGKP